MAICNTVKKAQEVYDRLIEEGIFENELNMLHSKYTKKDRASLENAIIKFGETENKRKENLVGYFFYTLYTWWGCDFC